MADIKQIKKGSTVYDIKDATARAAIEALGTASALDVAVSGDASSSQVVKGDDSRLTDARNAADVYDWAKAATKPSYTATEVGAVATTAVGANSGVASLDSNGHVPTSQLPSYVDDVIEGYYNTADNKFYEEDTYTTEITPEEGKIYVDLSTEKTYRWSGSAYVQINAGLALGETSGTAYEGNKGKANADNIATIQGLIPASATTSNKLATEADIPAVSNFIEKSSTAGLVKNDGTIDTTTYVSDITGKADKVASATSGNFAGLDANGNLTDSGSKASDFLTSTDVSGKADKVTSATSGNFAGLDSNGNLTDSGSKASDFALTTDLPSIDGEILVI